MVESVTIPYQRQLLLIKTIDDLDEEKRRLKAMIPGSSAEAKRDRHQDQRRGVDRWV